MMKKLIFPPLVLFVQFAFAQKSFNGLGMFQIGTDTSMIYHYAIKMHTKVVIADNSVALLKGDLEHSPKVMIYRLMATRTKAKIIYPPAIARIRRGFISASMIQQA
ncbi:MAG TPA: hypothetical protein VK668_01135 [Mucilaginibacter sp.]|nr:hypothetical protein [Mucilaginibacter sp.]